MEFTPDKIIDKTDMGRFENRLRSEEKSRATIEKYMRDAKAFAAFLSWRL